MQLSLLAFGLVVFVIHFRVYSLRVVVVGASKTLCVTYWLVVLAIWEENIGFFSGNQFRERKRQQRRYLLLVLKAGLTSLSVKWVWRTTTTTKTLALIIDKQKQRFWPRTDANAIDYTEFRYFFPTIWPRSRSFQYIFALEPCCRSWLALNPRTRSEA